MSEESKRERYIRLETESLAAASVATGVMEKTKHKFLAGHYARAGSKL
jgi:hypothetical protein